MMVRQLELRANLQMALKTSFRGFARINNCMGRATALDMETAGAMARFAAHVLRVRSLRFQT